MSDPSGAAPFPAVLLAVALIGTIAWSPAAIAGPEKDPRGNLTRTIDSIEAQTGEVPVNQFAGMDDQTDPRMHCFDNRFCESRIDELRIEAMGRQVEISPSPRTPPELLVGSCIGLLAAFTNENASPGKIEEFVHGATSLVLDGEPVSVDLGTFAYKMKLTAESLPSCKIVRFVQR